MERIGKKETEIMGGWEKEGGRRGIRKGERDRVRHLFLVKEDHVLKSYVSDFLNWLCDN